MTITPTWLRPTLVGLCLMILTALVACSGSENGSDSVLGPESAILDPSGSGSSEVRVEARLDPIIYVDASGLARAEDKGGTRDDRFEAEVELDEDDFDKLGIDAYDGFKDEVVRLTVTRNGAQVFTTLLKFTGTKEDDQVIVFEVEIRGAPAPELRRGDVARVSVNGTDTLKGTFERH